jgi:hypothetical protein
MVGVLRLNVMIVVVALLFASCGRPSREAALYVVLQGDEAGTEAARKAIDNDPHVSDPQSRKQYFLRIIKPDPKTDYKIVQIKPDPKLEYSLRVLDADGKDVDADRNSELADALQAKLEDSGVDRK